MGNDTFDASALEKANIKLTAHYRYSCIFLKCIKFISLNIYEFNFLCG
jgi:hypothetical protein